MINRFLLDEDLPLWWPKAISAMVDGLKIWRVGHLGAPPLQSPDPVLLDWCETHGFYLITNNRSSMPGHLADHVAQGRHVPGIFLANPGRPVVELANELELIAFASFPNEFQDLIRNLPF